MPSPTSSTIISLLLLVCSAAEGNNAGYNNLRRSGSTNESNDNKLLTEESTVEHRNLEIGDFSAVNDLLSSATLAMADFQTQGSNNIQIGATNIKCQGLTIGDMNVNYKIEGEQLLYDVKVDELGFTCDMDYSWSLYNGVISDNAQMQLESQSSTVSTVIKLESDDPSSNLLPNILEATDCIANIDLINLIFTGSKATQKILDSLKDPIKDMLKGQINTLVCEELLMMGKGMAQQLFTIIDNELKPHFDPIDDWRLQPLHDEIVLKDVLEQSQDGTQLVNFNDASTPGVAKTFVDILQLVNNHFKTTDTNSNNMGINKIIRDFILDDDKAYVLDTANSPGINPVLFAAQDRFTSSFVTIEKIRFLGLDSLTEFVPSTAVGDHTFQAKLNWEKATAEIFLKIEMTTATAMQSDSPNDLVENVVLTIALENLDTTMSLLMAADIMEIENLLLGSLLNFQDMISCINSIFHKLTMSGFDASVEQITQLSLTGFESAGIGSVAETIVAGLFQMYKGSILEAMPSYFQIAIRDSITKQLETQTTNAMCPVPTVKEGDEVVDLRDLFLKSGASNGHNDGRYGDVTMFLLDALRNTAVVDSNGSSQLNSNIGDVITFNSEIPTVKVLDSFSLTASNLKIQNLNTVAEPLDILQPSDNSPTITTNGIKFGPVEGRPFVISARMLFSITEAGAFFQPTESLVDLSVSVDSLQFVFNLVAMLKTMNFMQFPLKDTSNVQCWLNAFNENGLYIDSASLTSQNFKVSLKCVECIGPGAYFFEELADAPDGTSNLDTMIDGGVFLNMFATSIQSEEFKSFINELLVASPVLCPHSPLYNNETTTNYMQFNDILQAMLQNMVIKPFEDLFQGMNDILGANPLLLMGDTGTNSGFDEKPSTISSMNGGYGGSSQGRFSSPGQGLLDRTGGWFRNRKLKGTK